MKNQNKILFELDKPKINKSIIYLNILAIQYLFFGIVLTSLWGVFIFLPYFQFAS